MTSFTGISSGRVTRATWQRSGSVRSSTTSAAWARTGPDRAASRRPWAEERKVMAWPVAGASTRMRSALRLPLELLDLAQDEDVPDPGDGRGHHVEGARGDQPLGDPAHPVVGQVFEEGVVGGDPPGPDRPGPPVPARRSRSGGGGGGAAVRSAWS
jgi:hypothetical protein